MTDDTLQALAVEVGKRLKQCRRMLATAESCTGGWVAREITSIPGSSHWFDRGFVTYTNQSKQDMLGVPAEVLRTHGAVSEATVQAMAIGALRHSQAQLSLAITGIAGPGGGSEHKPVGTVWIAWGAVDRPVSSRCFHFVGDREAIRARAVQEALHGLTLYIDQLDSI